jgi:hypothetical protein
MADTAIIEGSLSITYISLFKNNILRKLMVHVSSIETAATEEYFWVQPNLEYFRFYISLSIHLALSVQWLATWWKFWARFVSEAGASNFVTKSRLALVPTQPVTQLIQVVGLLATRLHLVPRFRMHGARPPHLHTLSWCDVQAQYSSFLSFLIFTYLFSFLLIFLFYRTSWSSS